MFNSLATFLFGAQATSEPSDNCVENPEQQKNNQANEESCAVAAGDVIEVTSSTPSVAGNQRGTVQRSSNGNGSGKRGGAKQRRARQRQQQQKEQQQQQQKESKQAPSITKLLTPNGESPLEEDFNEDEWYIVEKEDGEEDSLPRSDSEEEELSVVESKPATSSGTSLVPTGPAYRRRQLHLQTHSLYSGPRPHQHRNRMSRTLNIRVPLTMSALSPPRIVPISDAGSNGNGNGSGNGGDDSDNSLTQSLYAPPSALSPCNSESSDGSTGHGSVVLMEESWYVTPPPCFTSIGPINMEASPFENLLIEHPSMSVYHSIRSSQAGTESFVNLDLGAAESTAEPEPEAMSPEEQAQLERQNRATSARFDRHHAAEQKKIELARRSLMNKVHDDHHRFVKTALTRSNKVMAQQSKGHQRRRSDMQHFRNVSGANNNRKCC